MRVAAALSAVFLAAGCARALGAATAAPKADLQCSLNGAAGAGGACVCDKPWKGLTCSVLDIKPRPKGAVPGMYGFSPNVSSWGGNVVKSDDGAYHLFVSEMVGGCGLKTWGRNSRIVHATSPTLDLTSPFTFKDASLGVWAHNAAPVRAPANHAECPGCYYLFHIGSGHTSSPPQNCTGAAGKGAAGGDAGFDTPYDAADRASAIAWASAGGLVHRSKSPEGPWDPLPSSFGCNNPAPAFAPNGTLFVLCSSSSIWRGDRVAAGDWTKIVEIDLNDSPWTGGAPSEYIKVEDPYLWADARGNWHLFCHRYDYRDGWPPNPNQTEPVLVSGHAFSEDLYNWHYSSGPQPFDPWVYFEDGTRVNYSTFERPHLVFGDDGVPTHSVHAVSPVWAQYGDHYPCEVCPARPGSEHSCVVCKSSDFYSWTYTLMQELNV